MRKLLLLILYILFPFLMNAQSGNIKGFVYEKENGEPILFTPVFLHSTTYGTTTDVNGFYSLTHVPAGDYILIVQATGFDSLQTPVTIYADSLVTQKIFLKKSSIQLQVVEVSAEKQAQRAEVRTSITTVTPREIKMIPSIGGEPDLAQYLQVLPGIVSTGDQGGQLYIRGGTPVMNKVLLDGMVIYNPFHSIGLFSVFDTDILKNADVYTGGFNAEYGDRISSVMDITTRDGNKKRFAGKFSATTFNSKLLLEGPIAKQKTDGGSSTSFVMSYKNSYLDQSSKTFYNYINKDGLPYSFNDFYGKVSMNGENGSKVSLFGFNFEDAAKFRDVADVKWKSNGFGSNFNLVPGGSTNLIDGAFSYSQYRIAETEANTNPRYSQVNGFNFGLNFTNFMKNDELKYGFEILGFRTNYGAETINGISKTQIDNTTEFGSFLRYRISRKKFVIEPSFRLQYYASLQELSPEPRLGMKWNITDYLRLKVAGGLYAQNLLSTSSDRDVVNLFYGFISGPDNLPSTFNGKNVTSHLQKADDAIVGFELDILKHLDLNVEVYYKDFTQLTNVNRDKIYPDNGDYSNQPDALVKDYIVETGKSYGADFVLKYEFKRIYIWTVYSLGYVTRFDGTQTYSPNYDRRNNVNLLGSYTFGKKLNWEFNVRWNYGSGLPFTKTAGVYEYQNFANGLYSDPNTSNGSLGIIYGDLNKGRMPDYHRMDVSLKRTYVVGKNSILEITASVINVYDRQNIFYFDRIRYQRVNQLPTLPSIGANLTF